MGDYWFDKQDMGKAESYYQQILDKPHGTSRQLAYYKLGFIRLFDKNFEEAFKYFENGVKEPVDENSSKSLTVRRELLTELVYVYTEIKPAKDALAYFEGLCDNSDTLVYVLEKLGNRYWVRQEWENAAPIYRRLLALNEDGEKDPDRAQRLYDSIRSSKGKAISTPRTSATWSASAARARADFRQSAEDRGQISHDFEIFCRDLATQDPDRSAEGGQRQEASEAEAADAYGSYLTLFRTPKELQAMRKNHGEALFASEQFVAAGRGYETIAKAMRPQGSHPRGHAALRRSSATTARCARPSSRSPQYETVYSRAAVEQLGAFYVKGYARNAHAEPVKFNVARAYYDEGNFKQAGELFAAFVQEYPRGKDVSIAAHLALDAYHNLGDFEKLVKVAQGFIANGQLPPALVAEMRDIATRSRDEEIDELALRAGETTGDIGQGLLEYAEQQKGTEVGERTLHAAFMTYRDKHDVAKMREVATKLLSEYPKSKLAAAELLTLAKAQTDAVDYEGAAQTYEEFTRRFPQEPPAVDAQMSASNLRVLLGDALRGEPSGLRARARHRAARAASVEIGVKIAQAATTRPATPARAEAEARKVLARRSRPIPRLP